MEYIYGAIFAWIFISFCFFILELVGIIDCFMESKALWILFAPMIFLVIFIYPISIYKETKLKISRQSLVNWKNAILYTKRLVKVYIFADCMEAKTSSYLYHFIIPFYIKIK